MISVYLHQYCFVIRLCLAFILGGISVRMIEYLDLNTTKHWSVESIDNSTQTRKVSNVRIIINI
jgi:hypothetical protein